MLLAQSEAVRQQSALPVTVTAMLGHGRGTGAHGGGPPPLPPRPKALLLLDGCSYQQVAADLAYLQQVGQGAWSRRGEGGAGVRGWRHLQGCCLGAQRGLVLCFAPVTVQHSTPADSCSYQQVAADLAYVQQLGQGAVAEV